MTESQRKDLKFKISELKSLSISKELDLNKEECLIELPSGRLIDYDKLRSLPVDVVNHFFELMTRRALDAQTTAERK